MTKQDILDLGWIHIGGFWYEWPVKNTIEIEEYSNRPLDFRLNFSVNFSESKYIIIEAYERNSFDWERMYWGPCRDVTYLTTLMKWFNLTSAK